MAGKFQNLIHLLQSLNKVAICMGKRAISKIFTSFFIAKNALKLAVIGSMKFKLIKLFSQP